MSLHVFGNIISKMKKFTQQIAQKLAVFETFADKQIEISHPCFSLKQGNVEDFIQEILETCRKIEQQAESDLLIFHTQRLVEQFDCLNKAVETQLHVQQTLKPFRSNYRFPKNIHHLPYEKRLDEYQKALRALNEKISWLIEQSQQASDVDRPYYLAQIEETEYRKKKCVDAIEDLSAQICKN